MLFRPEGIFSCPTPTVAALHINLCLCVETCDLLFLCLPPQSDWPFVRSVTTEAEWSLPHHHWGRAAATGSGCKTPQIQGGADFCIIRALMPHANINLSYKGKKYHHCFSPYCFLHQLHTGKTYRKNLQYCSFTHCRSSRPLRSAEKVSREGWDMLLPRDNSLVVNLLYRIVSAGSRG